MKRRKKAWGPSNALWRWQHRKGKTSRSRRGRGTSMARRRKSYKRSSGGGFMGLVKPALVGGLAAKFLNIQTPLGKNTPLAIGAVGGYMMKKNMTGAAAGAAGAYVLPMLLGGASGSAQSSYLN